MKFAAFILCATAAAGVSSVSGQELRPAPVQPPPSAAPKPQRPSQRVELLKPTPTRPVSIPVNAPEVKRELGKWRIQYAYEDRQNSLVITDVRFFSPQEGVALGGIVEESRIKGVFLRTRDGGITWQQVPLGRPGESMFFLDPSTGWAVGEGALWFTQEGGAVWTKRRAPKGLMRVHFLDAERGFGIGQGKTLHRTSDGGKTWSPVPETLKVELNDENTVLWAISFPSPKNGLVAGSSRREPRRRLPSWMEPEDAALRREVPSTLVAYETSDGGATWSAQIKSVFGRVMKISSRGMGALLLMDFPLAFPFPSEVLFINFRTGESQPIFRRANRLVTDMAITPGGTVYLAAIEPATVLRDAPIPGKLKVLRSEDLREWVEMDIDYRADANRAVISAVDENNIWIATDLGMVLKLEQPRKDK